MVVVIFSTDENLFLNIFSIFPQAHTDIYRAMENMQFKKVKKEIINCKKRDFTQTCRFYAKNRVFLQIEKNVVQKSTRMHKFC